MVLRLRTGPAMAATPRAEAALIREVAVVAGAAPRTEGAVAVAAMVEVAVAVSADPG